MRPLLSFLKTVEKEKTTLALRKLALGRRERKKCLEVKFIYLTQETQTRFTLSPVRVGQGIYLFILFITIQWQKKKRVKNMP